jgi:hypothetical protein
MESSTRHPSGNGFFAGFFTTVSERVDRNKKHYVTLVAKKRTGQVIAGVSVTFLKSVVKGGESSCHQKEPLA